MYSNYKLYGTWHLVSSLQSVILFIMTLLPYWVGSFLSVVVCVTRRIQYERSSSRPLSLRNLRQITYLRRSSSPPSILLVSSPSTIHSYTRIKVGLRCSSRHRIWRGVSTKGNFVPAVLKYRGTVNHTQHGVSVSIHIEGPVVPKSKSTPFKTFLPIRESLVVRCRTPYPLTNHFP